MSAPELLGYLRPDSTAGIRNHVLVVSAMDVTNPLARRIAAAVAGAVPTGTAFGRIHAGADRAQHERTRAGLIRNPNTAAALVVGFEPDTTAGVVEAAGDCGKPSRRSRCCATAARLTSCARACGSSPTWRPRPAARRARRCRSRTWCSG